MQIHQVKSDPTLQVSMYPRKRDFTPNIGYAEIRQVRFGDRFVDRLVFSDATEKITFGFFSAEFIIVWIAATYFERDVGCYDGWVVTNGFEENNNDAFFFGYSSFDFSAIQMIRQIFRINNQWCMTNRRFRVLFVASTT
jgi:hypothetical protein